MMPPTSNRVKASCFKGQLSGSHLEKSNFPSTRNSITTWSWVENKQWQQWDKDCVAWYQTSTRWSTWTAVLYIQKSLFWRVLLLYEGRLKVHIYVLLTVWEYGILWRWWWCTWKRWRWKCWIWWPLTFEQRFLYSALHSTLNTHSIFVHTRT